MLYFEHYIVTEPGLTPLKQYQLLSEDDYLRYQEEFGDDTFEAGIPESFNVLMKEMRSLGLNVELENT